MHYWIVEHDLFETRSKDHAEKRNQLNDKYIGTLSEASVIIVQGKEIKKPSWFKEVAVDLDQMMAQMGGRRNR